MKEEVWSIRKMREMQKLSQTRNTYKSLPEEEAPVSVERTSKDKTVYGQFLSRLQVFLEE